RRRPATIGIVLASSALFVLLAFWIWTVSRTTRSYQLLPGHGRPAGGTNLANALLIDLGHRVEGSDDEPTVVVQFAARGRVRGTEWGTHGEPYQRCYTVGRPRPRQPQ